VRTIRALVVCAVAVLTAVGCDTSSPGRTTPPAGTGTTGEQQWTMPNLVGAVLQDAQDQIQALTGGAVYFTDSHDLSGQDRNQVVDANWQVCTQSVEAGAPLTSSSRIDFGVVKLDETCP
jgi:hypothetical protein